MKYDITKPVAPAMPNLGKGTECFKILLSQTSFDMHAPLLPMLFPVLGTKISNAEFQYPSGQWLEMCGQQAALIADSAGNKGQLGLLVEACNRDFRQEDAEELKKYTIGSVLCKQSVPSGRAPLCTQRLLPANESINLLLRVKARSPPTKPRPYSEQNFFEKIKATPCASECRAGKRRIRLRSRPCRRCRAVAARRQQCERE